ncbi:MAG: hypothetical protein IKA87_04515 [Lentisphaeria bacterium]|nr:hypothetical protein [Lentisphaeria bacterium]
MICETGFIKALWGVCSGREIFRSLRNQSWWRVVLHLFFLSLICGLITANIQFRRIKPNIEAAQVAFDGVFGENVYVDNSRVSWNWVAPVKAPEKFREMAIPSGGRLYYTGTAAGMVPESLKTVSGPIVIWSPEQILFAQSVNGKFNAICIDGVSGQMSNREMSAEQLEHIFKSGRKLPAGLSKLPQENAGELFSGVSALTNCFMCIGTVLRNFLLKNGNRFFPLLIY